MDVPRAVPAEEGLSSVVTSNAQQGPIASTIKMAAEAVSPAVRKPWGKDQREGKKEGSSLGDTQSILSKSLLDE